MKSKASLITTTYYNCYEPARRSPHFTRKNRYLVAKHYSTLVLLSISAMVANRLWERSIRMQWLNESTFIVGSRKGQVMSQSSSKGQTIFLM